MSSTAGSRRAGGGHGGGFRHVRPGRAFAASLLGFIICANLNLSNMTTIEMYEKKKTLPWRYNVGAWKNFEEVFGKNPWLWFLPYHSPISSEGCSTSRSRRVSGDASDGLDPAGEPTRAGDSPRGMPREHVRQVHMIHSR